MPKHKESVKDVRISRKEIVAYIVIGGIILTVLFGYGVGVQGFRQAMIDKYGFWRYILGF